MLTTTTEPKFSAEYLRRELAGLGIKKPGKFVFLIILSILSVSFTCHVAADIEYAGQDLLFRGPRIFSWLKIFLPQSKTDPEDKQLHPELNLFASGKESIDATAVRQNGVYDCRFLAALASYAASDRGKDAIYNMIQTNKDGSYSVTFPSAPLSPVVVAPLSGLELKIYSRAVGPDGFSAGIWVPIIEKAYGSYLDQHQSLDEKFFHTIRHGVMDGRWTSSPELPGFAASFGAKDERASRILTGNDMKQLRTVSMELGDFGLGKGEVTDRQVKSWFNRKQIVAEYYAEQDAALTEAFKHHRIVIAITGIQENAEANGLMEHHAYAVVGYDSSSKKLLIRDVLNRSCFIQPGKAYKFQESDLSKPFWISIADFNNCFSGLGIENNSN
jgi:hypothetical protein